jgi:hypothetical protein
MALLLDPNKKLPLPEGDQFEKARARGDLGPLGESIGRSLSNFKTNLDARNALYNQGSGAHFNSGLGVLAPRPAPVRNPVGSTAGGVGSAPAGGVPASRVASPAVARPAPAAARQPTNFSGVRGDVTLPPSAQPTGIQRTVVNGVPTYSGLGAYAPQTATPAPALARPAMTAPSIAPVYAPAVQNATESRDMREARAAALSNLDFQDFLNRGHTTRSSRESTNENARIRAGLVDSAARVGAELAGGNRDAQATASNLALQQNAENNRTLVNEQGFNARTAYIDAGETERKGFDLQRPSFVADRDGRYLSVDATHGVARPVTVDGAPLITGAPEGSITPVAQLASLQAEIAAENGSLTPNQARIGALQQQVDALRRPSAGPMPGDVVKGYRFRGGDPAIAANWARVGGVP